MLPKHQLIISQLKEKYEVDENNLAMIVTGSVAIGNANEYSDLDLILITKDSTSFKDFEQSGVMVEVKSNTLKGFLQGMDENPMNVYQFLDSNSIFDKESILSRLQDKANQVIQSYRPQHTNELKKWLSSTQIKIKSAEASENKMLVNFLIATVIWKIVEGLYAVNSLPLPPTTTAYKKLNSLAKLPNNFENTWTELLSDDYKKKIVSTFGLIEFILNSI